MVLAKTVRNRFVLLLRVYPDTFALALASPRFRLAGYRLAFSSWRWLSGVRVVSDWKGGQTEWCNCCSGRFPQNGYNIVMTDGQPR